jgi:hypothetical protein
MRPFSAYDAFRLIICAILAFVVWMVLKDAEEHKARMDARDGYNAESNRQSIPR